MEDSPDSPDQAIIFVHECPVNDIGHQVLPIDWNEDGSSNGEVSTQSIIHDFKDVILSAPTAREGSVIGIATPLPVIGVECRV
jgi:hypothetical protein